MGQRWRLGRRFVGVIAVLTAAALASPPPSTAGEQTPTHLSVVIIADVVRVAGPNTFWTQLTAEPNEPVANATVELWVKEHGDEGFHLAKSGVTGENGELALTVKVLRNVRTKWKFKGDSGYLPSTSPVQSEPISPRVGLKVSDRTPKLGQKVVFTGSTMPARPGQRVAIYRGHTARGGYGPPYNPPVLLTHGRVDEDGDYRLAVRFDKAGKKNVFVQVSPGAGNMTGWSADRKITVG